MHAIKPKDIKVFGEKTLGILQRHYKGLESKSKSVLPKVRPGDVAKRFSKTAPVRPVGFDTIVKDIEEKILPGVTGWQNPRFFALYPANTTVPAIAGDTLVTGLGAVGLQWEACPAGTELEVVVMEWLCDAMGITAPFTHESLKGGGLIQNTASDIIASVAICTRVAKHTQLGVTGPNRYYADSSKFVVYMSSDTHFSGAKAVRAAGMQIHYITPTSIDGNYGITADLLEAAIEEDIAKGLVPCMVELNYGTTNTCGYDDFEGIARRNLREKYNIWIHADCAYAGASLMLPERHHHSRLIQDACTSFNINGSKWLLCGFDTSFLWVRDRSLLLDVYAATSDYLPTAHPTMYAPEFKDWAIPLGRKFRSLRVWMVMNYFGLSGMRKALKASIKQGDYLRARVSSHPHLSHIVRTDLGLVCFKAVSPSTGDNVSEQLAAHLTSAGFLVYPSKLQHGTKEAFIRIATGGVNTKHADVVALWKAIKAALPTM
eukprot:TRINITY_DN598_c0_g6_i1.p1 TRINITY_DN598_c0_g6~~TRINITY_DN598_c0_g6_i1.p1  ORF type:complete len:488 (+),score=150.94 TRINITY_DN598_c0_g6_i1:762-2225(+)